MGSRLNFNSGSPESEHFVLSYCRFQLNKNSPLLENFFSIFNPINGLKLSKLINLIKEISIDLSPSTANQFS